MDPNRSLTKIAPDLTTRKVSTLSPATRILYASPLRPIPLTLTVVSIRQVRGVVQTVYHVETVDKASGEIVRLVLGEESEVFLLP